MYIVLDISMGDGRGVANICKLAGQSTESDPAIQIMACGDIFPKA